MLDRNGRVPPVTAVKVAGGWRNREQLLTSIASRNNAYRLTGRRFMDARTCYAGTLDFDRLESARRYARRARPETASADPKRTPHVTDPQGSTGSSERSTLRLSGIGGSRRAARKLMRLTAGLLECGGESVEVESSGGLHASASWRALAETKTDFSLLDAFVSTIEQEDVWRSCGMHSLGLRDVMLDSCLPSDEAETFVRTWLLYTLEGPRLLYSGVTVRFGKRYPVFRLVAQPCSSFQANDPRCNPYGVWRLLRI